MSDEKFRSLSLGDIAEKLGIGKNTPTRWKEEGMPLHSWADFRDWVFKNKRQNAKVIRNLKAWINQEGQVAAREGEVVYDRVIEGTQEEGSEYALKRLEKFEVALARQYEDACQRGDKEEAADLLDQYTKVTNTLRQVDSMLQKDQREAGEVVAKKDMAGFFAVFGLAIGFAEEAFLDQFAVEAASIENEREVRQCGKGLLYSKVVQMLNSAVKDSKIPEWIVEEMQGGLDS